MSLLVLVLLGFLLRLHLGVKLDLCLELIICILILPCKVNTHLLQNCALLKHVSESTTTGIRPQLLRILRLLELQFLQRVIVSQLVCQFRQPAIRQNTYIQFFDIPVAIDSFEDPGETDGLE